jgi:4'-phosphopantetheinyl transferase
MSATARVVCCRLGLQPDADALASLLMRVPALERERILRLHRWQDALASAVGWCLLRQLCSDVTAGRGVVRRDRRGRPCVYGVAPRADVSLSHSGRYVVAAVSALGQVGVDVEARRELTPGMEELCLTPRELAWLRACADPADGFLRLWTLKEAYLKATGDGLTGDPRRVEFQLGGAAVTLSEPTSSAGDWRFASWRLPDAWLSLCLQDGSLPPGIEHLALPLVAWP